MDGRPLFEVEHLDHTRVQTELVAFHDLPALQDGSVVEGGTTTVSVNTLGGRSNQGRRITGKASADALSIQGIEGDQLIETGLETPETTAHWRIGLVPIGEAETGFFDIEVKRGPLGESHGCCSLGQGCLACCKFEDIPSDDVGFEQVLDG